MERREMSGQRKENVSAVIGSEEILVLVKKDEEEEMIDTSSHERNKLGRKRRVGLGMGVESEATQKNSSERCV